MSDAVTVPAGPYATVSVEPSSGVVYVGAADVEPVGTGDAAIVVDPRVTRAAAQRTVDLLTDMLPSLPPG